MSSADRASPHGGDAAGSHLQNGISKKPGRGKRIQACKSCHARKVKCSGLQPCQNCTNAGTTCIYNEKTRRVKISEKYLEDVLAENERLKKATPDHEPKRLSTRRFSPDSTEGTSTATVMASNPVMTENAWFVLTELDRIPNYLPEGACPAFATRFRQTLAAEDRTLVHFPRVQFLSDEQLSSSPMSQAPWPSKVDAYLFVKVAIHRVNRGHHVLLIKSTMAMLDQAYSQKELLPNRDVCKLFALFALGRVYSSHAVKSSTEEFPGLSYFNYAYSLMQILPERPNLEHIEALILLSFYSHNLNRRQSAYNMIGSAMRFAFMIGLHHNLPASITIDPLIKQHRICLWYTIYICDRMWASKLGYPLGTQDADFSVDLPSLVDVPEHEQSELPDPNFIYANIELARIAGDIINTIYRRNNPIPFVQSVQRIIRALKSWVASLPTPLKLLKDGGPTARHIVSLHLHFNHCLILATRPVLLYVLDKSRNSLLGGNDTESNALSDVIPTLKDACIHAARHSTDLLTQAWIDGSFTLFGYFDAQCLFSSAMILAISSVLEDKACDNDRFDSAFQLLELMAEGGNLSALEFAGHLKHIKQDCIEFAHKRTGVEPSNKLGSSSFAWTELTTEMVLGQTPMQDFLTQADFNFDIPNSGVFDENHLFLDWPAPDVLNGQ